MADDPKKVPEPEPSPFSDAVMQLYRQVREATTKDERMNAILALASRFAQEHDPGDHECSDDYHDYFESYEKARVEFRQKGMQLGRLAVHLISEFTESHEGLPNEPTAKPKTRNVN
jgi:hypothetical protein